MNGAATLTKESTMATTQNPTSAPYDATVDATPPHLSFDFLNRAVDDQGTENVVYISSDATYNKIDLRISLDSGGSKLTAGKITDPMTPPGPNDGTVMYLDLSNLQLSGDQFGKLALSATGWTFTPFPADNAFGMTPTTTIPIDPSSPIPIQLTGLAIPKALSTPTPTLYVTYYNVDGVSDPSGSDASFGVTVMNPPSDDKDLTQVLDVQLLSNLVVNSYDADRTASTNLTLEFSPGDQGVLVNAGKETVFTVSFVYGKPDDRYGYGALTDVARARKISPQKGDNVDSWLLTTSKNVQNPSWTLQPPAGAPIAGTGSGAIASVILGPIATIYQPGATVMVVSYANVPGYQDGAYVRVINKVAHVLVDNLTFDPDPVYFKKGTAKVTVKWTTRNATSLVLTQNYAPSRVTGQTYAPATLDDVNTMFALRATGPGGDNVDFLSVRAVALPVINTFAGAPTEIYSGSGSHDMQLSWGVDTPGKVALSSSAGEISGSSFDAVSVTSMTATQPQLITLRPVGGSSSPTLTRSLVVGGFTPSVQFHEVGVKTYGAAASPAAPFVALGDTANNQVLILDTVQFSQIATVPVGAQPGWIAISRDGSLLATANVGGSVSLVPVTISNGVPSFGTVTTVHLGGYVRWLSITPDGSRIYVTVADDVDGNGGRLVAVKAAGAASAIDGQVAVGKAPADIALDPSGVRIFVANSADDNVSIVGVGLQGELAIVGRVDGVTGQPFGLAITPDGRTLLAACNGAKQVIAIDAQRPNTGSRKTLDVDSMPFQIALSPDGAYAYVANGGGNTISVLNVWGGPAACSVVGSPITVNARSSRVVMSPDGLMLIVPNGYGTSIAVVTLLTYTPEKLLTAVGGQPTDVVAAPDGKSALIWHDGFLSTGRTIPGVRYYSTASGVASSMLGDIAVAECVFSPVTPALAFAISATRPLLYTIDLTDPRNPVVSDLELSKDPKTVTCGLAISGDGSMLFVLLVDHANQYTLIAGTVSGKTFTQTQSLPVYAGQWPGPVSMQSTLDGESVIIVDPQNQNTVVARRNTQRQYSVVTLSTPILNPQAVAMLPDGTKAFVLQSGTPNAIAVVDMAALTATSVALAQSYVQLGGLAMSPDGRRLFATDSSAGALRVLDPGSLRILHTIPLASQIQQAQGSAGVAVAPDGSRIYTANTGSATVSVMAQVTI